MIRVATCVVIVIALAFAFAPALASAQGRWSLANRGYFEVILAEPRGTQTQVLFPARADSFPFAVNDRRSTVWDISVGRELPIFGRDSKTTGSTPSGVPAGAFGFGLWFPLSFHMVEDMGKDESNPILDTDYRFGATFKAQYGLKGGPWSSGHLGVKFQVGHESTHLGDEFTLGALRAHSAEFIRVNVSYEYYDLAGAFEPNFGADGQLQLKLRAGLIWLWRPHDGWYAPAVLQPYGRFIAASDRNHEPYVQFELFRQLTDTGSLGIIVSADVRDRTVYQYNFAPDDSSRNRPEATQWSTNLMAGVRQVRAGAGILGKIAPTYYLRWYRGVNPAGQFRSQANYHEIGFGVQFAF